MDQMQTGIMKNRSVADNIVLLTTGSLPIFNLTGEVLGAIGIALGGIAGGQN